jgi:dTDP-4-amino-4,6-dideoxygalactose transaminase
VAGRAKNGDTALLPSYTFPATAEVLSQLGYALRFVDVDRRTWTIDPLQVDTALARHPARVVVGVDTFGNPADYARLRAVCDRHGAALIGDSAAALGSTIAGAPVGTQADAHAFSTSFAKVVSAAGAGGFACLPGDAKFGPPWSWDRSEGMSELHAIAALDQLDVLDALVAQRGALAATYCRAVDELAATRDARRVHLQQVLRGNTSTWTHFVVRVPAAHRVEIAAALAAMGVETKHYFPALHHSGFDGTRDGALTVTELLHREALALPMSSELTPRQVERVMVGVDRALGECSEGRVTTLAFGDDEDAIAV